MKGNGNKIEGRGRLHVPRIFRGRLPKVRDRCCYNDRISKKDGRMLKDGCSFSAYAVSKTGAQVKKLLDRLREFNYIHPMSIMNLLTPKRGLVAAWHVNAVAEGGFY